MKKKTIRNTALHNGTLNTDFKTDSASFRIFERCN